MSKENKSKYAILGMLSICSGSGYDLKKGMEQSTSNFWSESYGQIYPILKQLLQEGLATSHVEKQEGKPERHIYTLTQKGRAELQHWLTQPVEEAPERNELLLKLFFGMQGSVASNIMHVQNYQRLQRQLLLKYETIEKQLRQECDDENNMYSLITLSYGIHRCRALLSWCDETLTILRNLPKTH